MDTKKIRKSATLTGLVISIIFAIGLFTGLYLWLNYNAVDSGYSLDDKYILAYETLNDSTVNKLSNNVNEIKDALGNVTEAKTTIQVALNGFKGLGSLLKLPFTLVATTLELWSVGSSSLEMVPLWVKTLVLIAITAFIVFLIVANLKGEGKM